jgi:transposase-like protein
MSRPEPHSYVVSDGVVAAKLASSKTDEWAERIAAQGRSGMSVKQFCKEQGLTQCSFYAWRKRFQEIRGPVRFALVERDARRQERISEPVLELLLTTGERLCISTGVDAATLRIVLDMLRA